MDSLECVVHYNLKDVQYSNVTPLSENAHGRLLEAKAIRQELGGENEHKHQCDSIPAVINPSKHGIHLEPCYKKFTLIISSNKRKHLSDDHGSEKRYKSQRTSEASQILFPDHSYFCKQKRKTVKGKVQVSHKLTLKSTERTIKAAAEERQDEEVLRDIRDADLLAKEFQVHDKCRLEYTRKRMFVEGEGSNEPSGNLELVKEFIKSNIIEGNQAVSMAVVHEMYGDGHLGDTRYRSKLKQKILDIYPEQLYFLTVDGKTPQVIVSKEGISSNNLMHTKECLLHNAAKALRQDILDYENSLPDLPWPPQVETLKERMESMPKSLTDFLSTLLISPGHISTSSTNCLIQSFSQDLINGVTRGRVTMFKHFILGVGLHNITGQQLPIRILSHLGHCIDCKAACQSETAEAEIARQLYQEGASPGLKPISEDDVVLTHFWADNFNKKLESDKGNDMINSTHLVKFQENTMGSEYRGQVKTVSRAITRFSSDPQIDNEKIYFDKNKEPEKFEGRNHHVLNKDESGNFDLRYLLWNILRHI